MADSSDDDTPTISSDIVVTKYKMAADITNGYYLINRIYFFCANINICYIFKVLL